MVATTKLSGSRSSLLVLSLVVLGLALAGCGGADFGSAGIGDGGAITGRVLANVSGGWSDYTPLAGVYVVAQQVDGAGIIRSTTTNAQGVYRFDGLPLGTWRFGFSATGYVPRPVDTSWVTGYAEAGATYTVVDVYMDGTAATGDGNVYLTVRNAVSGQAVAGATVMVGPATGVTDWYGEVRLSVPVRIDYATGQPLAERVVVSASGVDGSTVSPSYVTPSAYGTVYATVVVQGWGTTLSGQIRINSPYEQYYLSRGVLSSLSITSDTVPSYYLAAQINPSTGYFTVTVPSGTTSLRLYFDNASYFTGSVVGPISVPSGGGVVNLSSPVYLYPITRSVSGYLVNSSGMPASGYPAQVAVQELGLAVTPSAGTYAFGALPTGLPLTFVATAVGPTGYLESGTMAVVVTGGSTTPFYVPTIRTGY